MKEMKINVKEMKSESNKKKGSIMTVFVIGIFLFSLIPAVLADNEDSKSRKKAGTTPDSFLYGLDIALDNIRYALSVSPDAKARIGLETAEERLMEVREMVLQNKIEAAKQAGHEHKKAFMKVKASVDTMSKRQNNETIKKLNKIKEAIEQYEDELEHTHANINIEIKSKGDLTSEQKAVIETVLKSLQNQTVDVKININMHRDEIKIKIREDTDEDDDDEIETGNIDVEVRGNVNLSQEVKAALDRFVANLSSSSEVEIELEIAKKNNTISIKKEKIEGRLTTAQMSLWNDFKNKAIALVNSKENNADLKIEVEIEHKEKDREDDDLD